MTPRSFDSEWPFMQFLCTFTKFLDEKVDFFEVIGLIDTLRELFPLFEHFSSKFRLNLFLKV